MKRYKAESLGQPSVGCKPYESCQPVVKAVGLTQCFTLTGLYGVCA